MKILLFRTNGNKISFDGYNLQELGLAKALCKQGHTCDVLYFNGNEKTYIQTVEGIGYKINIIWKKGVTVAGNGIFFGLRKYLRAYDIIQVSEYDQLTSLYLLFFSRYKKKVTLYHGPYLSEYNQKYRKKCKFIDLLPLSKKRKHEITCFAKSKLAKSFLYRRGFDNVYVTGVGLDFERFENDHIDGSVNQMVNHLHGFSLLYIGKIEMRRNTMFLIRLVHSLKNDIPNIKLVIVGNGDSDYVEQCKSLIVELQLENNVFLHDRVDQGQVGMLYRNASAFLLPTSYEIYGMVIMEAMYYSLPVITTYNGGSSTIIDNNKNGFILKIDEDKWKATIKKLFYNEDFRMKIGQKAHDSIVERSTWERVAEIMTQQYSHVRKDMEQKDE